MGFENFLRVYWTVGGLPSEGFYRCHFLQVRWRFWHTLRYSLHGVSRPRDMWHSSLTLSCACWNRSYHHGRCNRWACLVRMSLLHIPNQAALPSSKSVYQVKFDALTGVACASASSTSRQIELCFKKCERRHDLSSVTLDLPLWLDIAHDSPSTMCICWGMINTPSWKLTRGHQRRWTQHDLPRIDSSRPVLVNGHDFFLSAGTF